MFYLPSYSPELNPEERLNADLKQAIGKKVPVRTKAKLRDATQQPMDMLKSNPDCVRGFFQDKWVICRLKLLKAGSIITSKKLNAANAAAKIGILYPLKWQHLFSMPVTSEAVWLKGMLWLIGV